MLPRARLRSQTPKNVTEKTEPGSIKQLSRGTPGMLFSLVPWVFLLFTMFLPLLLLLLLLLRGLFAPPPSLFFRRTSIQALVSASGALGRQRFLQWSPAPGLQERIRCERVSLSSGAQAGGQVQGFFFDVRQRWRWR